MADDARSVASGGGPPQDGGLEARVAVLEQIAKDTREALIGIRAEMAQIRAEMAQMRAEMAQMRAEFYNEFRSLRADQRADFRTLLTLYIGTSGLSLSIGLGLLLVLAKAFHWIG